MTAAPTITIVTPSFNQGKYIERTVRSVLLQRYPHLEYIVMDGGSTDGTMAVLERYRSSLAYLVSERDDGQADALARGFARSSGDIMAYLNSDDMLGPQTLAYVAWFFERHQNIDVVYSHRLAVDENDRVVWYWHLPRHSSYMMSRWDLIPQETCFWRRRIFEKSGNIDSSFLFAMDYDLFIRFMRNGRFHRANRFLGAFRVHDVAKTTTLMNTVGVDEIQRVWQTYGLRRRFFYRIIAHRLSKGTNWRGSRLARTKRMLPGGLPGIGYSYDRVWGGRLHGKSFLPPSQTMETVRETTSAR